MEILDKGGLFPQGAAPIYDPEEAASVTHQNLPEDLKSRLREEDVGRILELELSYQEKEGLVAEQPGREEEPAILDTEKMIEFIRREAQRQCWFYSSDTIRRVLEAEEVYLKQAGIA